LTLSLEKRKLVPAPKKRGRKGGAGQKKKRACDARGEGSFEPIPCRGEKGCCFLRGKNHKGKGKEGGTKSKRSGREGENHLLPSTGERKGILTFRG